MKAHRRSRRGTLRDIIHFTIKIKRVLAINEKQKSAADESSKKL